MNHVILLGDSIFDNAAYVGTGPAVISQLRAALPPGWQATLAARDGSVAAGVDGQVLKIPRSATHMVVSVGGNDGLSRVNTLEQAVSSVGAAVKELAVVRREFEANYRNMLD